MKKLWYKLAKNNIGTTETPIQNPQVWVSETHTYNEALNRLEIKWRLSVGQVQAQVLLVNIYHSSTATGATENHVWQLPTGQTSVEGTYFYPLANVSNVSDLKFGITAGAGYSIPDTAQRPNEVVVSIATATASQPTAPAAPTNGVVDDSANTFSFTKNPNFTTNQHFYSFDGGVTKARCTNTVLQVGNKNKAVGDIRVWVEALNGNPAGNHLYNAEPFTETIANSGGNTPASYNNPVPTTFSGPIEIWEGGVYDGLNRESTEENVPAIKVMTRDAVTFVNCNTKANGYGIVAGLSETNITVLNTRHFGGALSTKRRTFVISEYLKNLVIENCYVESSGGIYTAFTYMGNGTPQETIKIRYNSFKNIDGRTVSGRTFCQFFQSNTVRTNVVYRTDNAGTSSEIKYYQGIPNMEIAWNKIVNEPGLSDVEDNLNLFNTRGHTASPISIHNNYIHGAYYYDWQGVEYHGSGMICDSPGTHRGMSTAYVNFHRNVVIMSNAASFGVAGGNNIKFTENVEVGKGYLGTADATRLNVSGAAKELKGYPSGIYVDDNRYKMNSTFNVTVDQHTAGVVGQDSISLGYWRNDLSREGLNTAWATVTNTILLANPITEETENFYTQQWENRRSAANITIGVVAPAI